ncbi:tetratricopeptide repeat protein [Pseudonocardia sp. RS010]|uniref:tetratricopeptide repeat protein n=1 Tax=Pseudonocardia sp. RS010 TaxID=3385979 RepID=UPI0039A31A54
MKTSDVAGHEGPEPEDPSPHDVPGWAEPPPEESLPPVPESEVAEVLLRFRALDALGDPQRPPTPADARDDWRREMASLLRWSGRNEQWVRARLTAAGEVAAPVQRVLEGDVTVRAGLAAHVVELLGGRWVDDGYLVLFEAAREETGGRTGEHGPRRTSRHLSGLTGADPGSAAAERVPAAAELPVLHGREELIAELVERAAPPIGPPLVLVGPAGLGKTSTARAVAARLDDGRGRAFCVTAHDLDDLCDGLYRVARLLGAPAHRLDVALKAEDPARRAAELWEVLEDADDPWTVVLDDAGPAAPGDPAWARVSGAGTVVVTTRGQGDWGTEAVVHRVGALDPDAGARVILDRLPEVDRAVWAEAARRLSVLLGGMPLALRGAADAAVAGGADRLRALLAGLAPESSEAPDPVAVAYRACVDALPAGLRDRAVELLQVLGCFQPEEPVPTSVLTTDPATLDALVRVGLVEQRELRDGTPVLRLHQGFAHRAREAGGAAARRRAVAVLTRAADALDSGRPTDWPAATRLHAHAGELLDSLPDDASDTELAAALRLADRVAGRLARADGSPASLALLDRAVALTVALGDDHPARLDARQTRAWAVAAVEDDLERAETLVRAVVADKVRVHGRRHPATLSARDLLGWVLAEQRRLTEAARRLVGVLADRTELLGALHRDTLATRHRLAWVLGMSGDRAEAEQELRAVVELRRQTLGTGVHLDVYNSRYRLGCLLAQDGAGPDDLAEAQELFAALRRELEDQGLPPTHSLTLMVRVREAWVAMRRLRFVDAMEAYSELLVDQEKVLGVDHPRTLRTRHMLARLTLALGDARRAEEELRGVVRRRREVLGPDHPHTMDSRSYRAWALLKCGRVQAADRELVALLADRRRVLGEEHRATLTTRYLLARVITQRGRLADARRRFAQLLPFAVSVLGPSDRLVLEIRHGAAVVEALQGRLGAAEEELRAIRAVREQVLGADDPDTLATREYLVWVVGSAGRVSEALLACDSVLADLVRVLGAEHPHALVGRYRRIWLLGLAGRRAEAFAELDRFAALLPAGRPDLDDLRCATVTAWLLRLDGRLDEAEREARRAVKLHDEVVGAHEVDTMRSLDALGLVFLEKHRLEEAEIVFRDVLGRRVGELGEAHVDTLVAREHLARVLVRRGERSAAASELEKVREGARALDPEHPLVRRLPEVGWGRW